MFATAWPLSAGISKTAASICCSIPSQALALAGSSLSMQSLMTDWIVVLTLSSLFFALSLLKPVSDSTYTLH